jgi:putative transposase
VLACHRYIERNPVRAGMVQSAAAYRWSSHEGNTGRIEDKLLTPHIEYLSLAHAEQGRRLAYRQLFCEADDPGFLAEVRDATNGGYPLLGAEMKARVATISTRALERRKPGPPRSDETISSDGSTAELPF